MKHLLVCSLFAGLAGVVFLRAQDAAPTTASTAAPAIAPNAATSNTAASSTTAPDEHPLYLDKTQPIEARVEDLLKRLTPEEKDALLHADATFATAALPRFNIPERWMSDGPNGVREEIQRDSWNSVRPASDLTDASTAFPCGICLAATWNPELARHVGESIGEEGRARGKDIILGPAVNIQRTPLNGRTFEYYGEDPWLSGRIAVGFIQGEQSKDVSSCVKHFAANNQETDRTSVDVEMDERTLREIYLPAFESAIKEGGSLSIMASYNHLFGTYAAENDYLLNEILKKEWGFKGLVMTDWGASHTTDGSARGGLDLEMGTSVGSQARPADYETAFHLAQPFLDGVKDGTYPMSLLDDKARRNLYVMFATHMLDGRTAGSINTPEHQTVSREVAEEGMVLLKNENNALPLDASKIKTLALIGDNAIHLQASGGESSGIKALYEISPRDGITKRVGDGVKVVFAQGYVTPTRNGAAGGRRGRGAVADPAAAEAARVALIDQAVDAAKQADVAIVFAGLNKNFDTEGSDRPDMKLPGGQDELIQRVIEANPRTIVVMVAGSPVEMGPWLQKTPALLLTWYDGSEAGNAIAHVLFGDVNPSGKLPCTFPKALADTPTAAGGPEAYPGVNRTETYKEGLLVGYRWYDTKNIEPLFPFGYGLSYTQFKYANLKFVASPGADGPLMTAQFDVTNTGARDGAEVAQLYIHQNNPGMTRPEQELKGFQKIALKAGETKTVAIPLGQRAFAYFNTDQRGWLAEAGDYQIRVGSSSRDIRLQDTYKLPTAILVH